MFGIGRYSSDMDWGTVVQAEVFIRLYTFFYLFVFCAFSVSSVILVRLTGDPAQYRSRTALYMWNPMCGLNVTCDTRCREYEGTVLPLGDYVFLDVDWLAKVLEPVLNHKGIEGRGGARVFGDVEITEQWQGYSLQRLEAKGILEQRLAAFLWPGYTEHVLAALARIGLTFPLPGDEAGGLVVPLRLPETRPPYVGQELTNFSDRHQKSLTMHWKMPYGVPPGGIERIISRCARLGAASLFWRFGALVRVEAVPEVNDEGGVGVDPSFFMLEYNLYRQELEIGVWGDLTMVAAWATLSYVLTVVRDMTLQFPGLRWEAFLGCPDHPGEVMNISEVSGMLQFF